MSIILYMRRNYKFILPIVLLSGILLSFKFQNQPNPEKDKTILQVLAYILTEGHYQPIAIDDQFSEGVYDNFIEALDPSKNYFYQSDIKEFEKFKHQIDDQILAGELTFFELVYGRYIQRFDETKPFYLDILSKPMDVSTQEVLSLDFENANFPLNKKEREAAWKKQLKWRYIGTLYDKDEVEKDKVKQDSTYQRKSMDELAEESLEKTKENMDELHKRQKELNRDDYYSVFLNAITIQFEPHTNYFDPIVKDRFDVSMSGKLEGIGARLQKEGDYTKVFELISGGPAWRSGELEVGDIILKVAQGDGEPLEIVGMRLDNAIEYIKGKKGTEVRLTLKKVDGTIKTITLIRDIVEIEETFVKSSIIEKNGQKMGIIHLPKFYFDMDGQNFHNSTTDMEKEISRMKEEGIQGLMIDLRDNGGGSLKTAVEISGLFIDKGPIVQVKYRGERPQVRDDNRAGTLWDGPLVILVNELSASASEIFAAAMQDYKRAVIIGSKQTYGKGTVQNFYELKDYANSKDDLGSVKMTIQKFYRIDGSSTQLKGVTPDVIVPTRYSFMNIGERDETNPLPWDKVNPVNFSPWAGYVNFEEVVAESNARIYQNPQFKLIDQNAKWLNDRQEDKIVQLNFDNFKKEINDRNEEVKKFDDLKNYLSGLNFQSTKYEKSLLEKDSILAKKREVWHTEMTKDIYIDEAVNVLESLKVAAVVAVRK